jgi:hypothetical protein
MFGFFRTGSAASEQVWLLLNWLCCLGTGLALPSVLNLLPFRTGLAPAKLALLLWNRLSSF